MTSRMDILAWINTNRASDNRELVVEMCQDVFILPLLETSQHFLSLELHLLDSANQRTRSCS